MRFQIITLFPEMFAGVFEHSMLFKAQDRNLVDIELINLREFGHGKRKTVDDMPYGGGDGMLLKVEPLMAAVEHAKSSDPSATVLLMTPRGARFKQSVAQRLAKSEKGIIIICGRYEGYDERITSIVDEQISIGDYVLTGGEIPAMAVTDAVTRLLPGVLGGETSAEDESFTNEHMVEYPQYTRPEEFKGLKVPDVLLSGNHQAIAEWRKQQSKKRTQELFEENQS